MTGTKSRPRSLRDYIASGQLFDAAKAREIIDAVGTEPDVDADAIPDQIKQADSANLACETLAFHLNGLARHLRWEERRQHLPKPSEIEKRTRKIADLCRQLSAALLDDEGHVHDGIGVGYLFAYAALEGEEDGQQAVQSIANDIVRLKGWAISSADRALARHRASPASRGRRKDAAFHDMLERLSGIYFYIWKKTPGRSVNPMTGEESGPYFRFARAVVRVASVNVV